VLDLGAATRRGERQLERVLTEKQRSKLSDYRDESSKNERDDNKK